MQNSPTSALKNLFSNIDSFLLGLSIIMIASGMLGLFFLFQDELLSQSQDLRSRAHMTTPPYDNPIEVVVPIEVCAENADLNGDNTVNIEDYSILSQEFFTDRTEYAADINCDDAVDIRDYSIMARAFSILN